jgi:ribonuclease-3
VIADDDQVAQLQAALGYQFAEADLLQLALLHRSHAAEHELAESYERLEFLGDAVLQLAVTHYLYGTYEALAEGEMAKVRAAVVSEAALARIARGFDVGEAIRLGRGEELTGGKDKDSIISDVMESIIGAIYLDGGFDVAREFVLAHWSDLIDSRATDPGKRDFKTRLQEQLAQAGALPRYDVSESGPEHAKVFTAVVSAGGKTLGTGTGTSKKRSEQAAAEAAFVYLEAGDA